MQAQLCAYHKALAEHITSRGGSSKILFVLKSSGFLPSIRPMESMTACTIDSCFAIRQGSHQLC
jgi:hypothetical protein